MGALLAKPASFLLGPWDTDSLQSLQDLSLLRDGSWYLKPQLLESH